LGGGSGYLMMMVSVNLVKVPLADKSDFELVLSYDEISSELGYGELSSTFTDAVSPRGDMVAFWNCSTLLCDTERGVLYLFTTDWKQKASLDVPGEPSFLGWSDNQDRLLYYLGSTMADDYYLVKTEKSGFGEVIPLGRLTAMTWSPDRKTLYAQKGSKVSQLDKNGVELQTWTCIFDNACMAAPSPDGKRFAGIQKFVASGTGNPTITISNADFSDKKTVFISEDKALILGITWLPDNQHLVVFGESYRQRLRRFLRWDYLSVINVETGEERRITLDVPEESEDFLPCGLSPDGTQLVYRGLENRIKEQGRIYFANRFARVFPIASNHPVLERMTEFDAVESCPTWVVIP